MKALVFRGTVQKVAADNATVPVSPSFEWVPCDDTVKPGYSYDGNTFEAPYVEPDTEPPTLDELYDNQLQQFALLKALALALNDGSFVPGSGYTGAQMKAIIKAKM